MSVPAANSGSVKRRGVTIFMRTRGRPGTMIEPVPQSLDFKLERFQRAPRQSFGKRSADVRKLASEAINRDVEITGRSQRVNSGVEVAQLAFEAGNIQPWRRPVFPAFVTNWRTALVRRIGQCRFKIERALACAIAFDFFCQNIGRHIVDERPLRYGLADSRLAFGFFVGGSRVIQRPHSRRDFGDQTIVGRFLLCA